MRAQVQLRLLAWDIIEEVGEVGRAVGRHEQVCEIIDVAHFLIELMICSGIQAYDLRPLEEYFDQAPSSWPNWHDFTSALAGTMYQLKAKPWKKNVKASNAKLYRTLLIQCFSIFMEVIKHRHMVTPGEFYRAYFDKAVINHQRSL